jgi:hypothetical protein
MADFFFPKPTFLSPPLLLHICNIVATCIVAFRNNFLIANDDYLFILLIFFPVPHPHSLAATPCNTCYILQQLHIAGKV